MFAIDRAYEIGATSFVTKPINWRLMGHQMRYVMRSHRAEMAQRQATESAQAAADIRTSTMALMSHETRTPLSVVLGFASMILAEPHGSVGHAEYLAYAANIKDAGERLFRTLTSLQLFAEISVNKVPDKTDQVEAQEIVQAAIREARIGADERQRIQMSSKLNGVAIDCDQRLMVVALANLIRNALTHSGKASIVRISCDIGRDGAVAISVTDDGVGMNDLAVEMAQRPFLEKTQALLQHGEGLRIGLPIACRVAEIHGGRLELKTSIGIGTSAIIHLPAPTSSSPSKPLQAAS
jgi:signal transduction histidine kinase